MQFWILYSALLMLSYSAFSGGVEIGCKLWKEDRRAQEKICCTECHTGNRMVEECGKDPAQLCTPCKNGTFTKTKNALSCDRCNECVDPQVVLQRCHGTTDTVCGCKAGYRCSPSNSRCSMCLRECDKGQQSVNGICKPCPEGTFNDKINGRCLPWTKCQQWEKTVTKGTASTDNKCEISNEIKIERRRSTPVNPPPPDYTDKTLDEDNNPLIWIPMSLFFLFIVVFFVIAGLFVYQNKISKAPTKTPVTELPTTPVVMPVEQEECSFCQPQQEQGSSESLSTQDSMEKLLPV